MRKFKTSPTFYLRPARSRDIKNSVHISELSPVEAKAHGRALIKAFMDEWSKKRKRELQRIKKYQ